MLEDDKEKVIKKINKLYKKGYFKNKQVYLFGVSDNTRQIISILREKEIEPVAVIDNDISKQKSLCARKVVIPIIEVGEISSEENVFLVFSAYWREMVAQLHELGAKKSQIIRLCSLRKSLSSHIMDAYKGRKHYEKLVKKYDTNNVYLCPYTGTGDIYLIGTFWQEYCEKNNVDKYIFIVVSGACKKVAELCEINNIEVLKNKKVNSYLISAHMLWPKEVNLKLLNDCWAHIHTNQIEWFRGYKSLEFTPMFRRYVFNLPESSKPSHPPKKDAEKDILEIMSSKGIRAGKTVVLSPYSNTLAEIADGFWESLAEELKKRNYSVCTNSSGDTEPAIKGTIPVFFPLTIAPQFIEIAGGFIGIRSGFCDVISSANAKKIILYDKMNRFYMGSAFEYFNLKDMELCDDALEVEFENSNIEECLQKIIKIMGE